MTQFQPTPPAPPTQATAAAAQGGGGVGALAVIALALAIVGLCVPGLGLFAIIFGGIALARATSGGRGLAIAAISIGTLSILVSVMMVGLLLPALGKARTTARQLQSSANMQLIATSMFQAGFDGETDGVVDYNLQAQLAVPANAWAPREKITSGVGTAYLLLVPADREHFIRRVRFIPLLVENPNAFERDTLNVVYADGSVQAMPRSDALRAIESVQGRVYNTDGTLWKP